MIVLSGCTGSKHDIMSNKKRNYDVLGFTQPINIEILNYTINNIYVIIHTCTFEKSLVVRTTWTIRPYPEGFHLLQQGLKDQETCKCFVNRTVKCVSSRMVLKVCNQGCDT